MSKLLLLIEKGSLPVEYKGKSLNDINFDEDAEYPEENNEGKFYILFLYTYFPCNFFLGEESGILTTDLNILNSLPVTHLEKSMNGKLNKYIVIVQ